MYLSLGVDIGRGGSPNHAPTNRYELRNHPINVLLFSLTIFAPDEPA